MSDVVKGPSGAADIDASGTDQQIPKDPNVDPSGTDKNKVAYETYRKVLAEKKKADARLTELEAQFQSIEADKMQAEGKKDELIDKMRADMDVLKKENSNKTAEYAFTVIKSQVATEAAKMGCQDTEALMRLIDVNELADHVDEKYNVDKNAVSELLEGTREKYSSIGLFGKQAPKINNGTPAIPEGDKPSLEGSSVEDLSKLLAQQFYKD